MIMSKTDMQKVEAYLRRSLNPNIRLIARPPKKDSCEVMIGEEHIGLIYKDDEDGETSFIFEMAILSEDL
jgi:hypothetical protein